LPGVPLQTSDISSRINVKQNLTSSTGRQPALPLLLLCLLLRLRQKPRRRFLAEEADPSRPGTVLLISTTAPSGSPYHAHLLLPGTTMTCSSVAATPPGGSSWLPGQPDPGVVSLHIFYDSISSFRLNRVDPNIGPPPPAKRLDMESRYCACARAGYMAGSPNGLQRDLSSVYLSLRCAVGPYLPSLTPSFRDRGDIRTHDHAASPRLGSALPKA